MIFLESLSSFVSMLVQRLVIQSNVQNFLWGSYDISGHQEPILVNLSLPHCRVETAQLLSKDLYVCIAMINVMSTTFFTGKFEYFPHVSVSHGMWSPSELSSNLFSCWCFHSSPKSPNKILLFNLLWLLFNTRLIHLICCRALMLAFIVFLALKR